MSSPTVAARPDLHRRSLLLLLALFAWLGLMAVLVRAEPPGMPLRQLAAAVGSLLLVVPCLFVVAKRSGRAASPPAWFVAHVLASLAGALLVLVHASDGDWLSPPGMVLGAMLFLVLQGLLARAFLNDPAAGVFASRLHGFARRGGAADGRPPREELAALIEAKRRLLKRLDPQAEEGLFSPVAAHWLHRPRDSWRYARLAARERRLVGARHGAHPLLAGWRRMHVLVAWLFWLGLLLHVVTVTFFAGYVAGDGDVYWWHLAAWGR